MSKSKSQTMGAFSMEESKKSYYGFVVVGAMIVAAALIAVYGSMHSDFLLNVEAVVVTLLTVAANFLYLIGTGLIVLGSILVTTRYVKSKIRAPFTPFHGLPRARYLTISLELFIGAEVIKTVIARTYDEFLLLMLTIGIRGLVAAVLYLEQRWHAQEHVDHTGPLEPESK